MNYPEAIPTENILRIVAAIRNPVENSNQIAFDAWVTQGYVFKIFFGEPGTVSAPTPVPSDPVFSLFSMPENDREQVARILEDLAAGKPQPQAAVPWGLVIQVILALIQSRLGK